MMEKPPGLSVAETTELRDAAAAAGVKGMVAWNRRFHPIIAKAREMVLERGPITQVLGEFHKDMRSFVDENIAGANMSSGRLIRGQGRKREWFDGEDWHLGFPPHILDKMFMESPVHALDVVRAMGGDVADCHAFSRRAFTDYRDVHTVSMLHTNGCISTVIANYTQPQGNRLERYEIHGHGITAHLEGVNKGWVQVDGVEGRVDISDSTGAGDGGTTEQLRYFTDAVLSNRSIDLPAANFDEAIKTMIVAEKTLNASPVISTLYQVFGLRTADSPHTHTHSRPTWLNKIKINRLLLDQDSLSTQLKALIAASEAGAQEAWRATSGGVGDQVSATAERRARL